MSGNVVPIWFHEGIAKFQESRWHTAPAQPLAPPKEDLLSRSSKSDQLITFDQMHPSMAKLPSQEAASLAFAQVHTVIDFLYRKKGYGGIRKLIKALMKGNCIPTTGNGCIRQMNRALRSVYGFGIKGLWKTWRKDLQRQGLKTYPGLVQRSLKFKRPGMNEEEDSVDYDTIDEKRVKDHAHLGELLRARGRFKAALAEYRKAIKIGGDGNPLVQNGAATAMLNMGLASQVPQALSRVLKYYPNALKTHLNLGEAYLESKKTIQAIASFEAAIGINPFHPRPYAALVQLYQQAGRSDDVARMRKTMEILK
jgi:tetratricopeptide (TPR) repeat protein